MTTPATTLPSWATAATYAAGPDTGLSVRLEPAGATKSTGHVADTRTAARTANWIEGALCDWVSALAPVAYCSWNRDWDCLLVAGATYSMMNPGLGQYAGQWFLPVAGIAGVSLAGHVCWHPSTITAGAHQSSAITVIGATSIPMTVACGGATFVTSVDPFTATDTIIYSNAVTTLAPTPHTLIGGTANPIKVQASGILFVAANAKNGGWGNGETYWTGSSDGATWTPRTVSSFPDYAATLSHIAVSATGELAMGFINSARVLFSSDAGVTWTLTLRGGAGNNTVGLAHTSTGWLALDANGSLWRYNGSAWVTAGTLTNILDTAGAAYVTDGTLRHWHGNVLASDDKLGVVALGYTFSTLVANVSLDGGLTWRAVVLARGRSGSSAVGWQPRGVCFGDGQFYAVGDGPDAADAAYAGALFSSLRI